VHNHFNYDLDTQNQKQKISERLLNWQLTYARGGKVGAPNCDKEVSHNHIPLLTSGQEVFHLALDIVVFSTFHLQFHESE